MLSRKCLVLSLIAQLVPALTLAHAGEAEKEAREKEIDTQFIFGFTMGADVGELGERELEHQTTASLGKRGGAYSALTDQLRFEVTPAPNFRFEIGAPIAYYNISGVSGLDNRNQGAFNGVQTEFRYRLLDREHASFGLTIGAEPHWSRTDETSGERVANYGGELSIAFDRELVKDRVFAAVNLVYDPEVTLMPTGFSERDSTIALTTSVTTQVFPGTFVGAEARYLRKYEGLGLNSQTGQGLFLGPTTFVRLSKSFAISGAWSIQVAGHASDMRGPVDLTNFSRHQALLRVEYNF
jgi:hypothetical protein